MADRNGYIGRAPGDSSITIARKTYEPTGVQTDFTFDAGYDPGYCDVYLNGARLISGNDYTASNGNTVGLTSAAQNGDILEIIAYKAFNLGVPLSDITGNLDVTGNISASSSITAGSGTGEIHGAFVGDGSGLTGVASTDYIITGTAATFNSQVKVLNLNVTGVSTVATAFYVGTALTANAAGDVETIGIITAATFSGDGSGLTGVANTEYVVSVATTTADLNVTSEVKIGSGVTIGSAGVATFTNGVSNILFGFQGGATAPRITLGDIAGNYETKLQQNAANGDLTIISDGNVNVSSGILLKVQDTTDATSTSTGALIISGGVGIAKSLHVGQNVTIGGTLTYEDVTNVDSIGLVTARAGLNVSGGQLLVGSGLTIGNAGIATFADGSATANGLHFGTDGDLKLYHNGSNAHIKNGTGNLTIDCTDSDLVLQAKAGENSIYCVPDAQVQLYYDNAVKLKTATTGINPSADSTDDLGTSAIRWRNIYGDTLYGDGSNLTNLPAAGLSTEALITSGITTVLDLSNAQDHKITATGICTITTSGGTEGESHTIRITNSGIATVGFSSYFQFAGGASPVLTKTDGAVNLVSFTVNKTATTTGITTELLTSVANNFS